MEQHFILPGLCQHEIVSGIYKIWKQCGAVESSYGCLVSHVCMASVSQFLPHNSATLGWNIIYKVGSQMLRI